MHPLLGTWPATQARALTGNQTCNALLPSLMLNPLSHTSQKHMFSYSSLHHMTFQGKGYDKWYNKATEEETGEHIQYQ